MSIDKQLDKIEEEVSSIRNKILEAPLTFKSNDVLEFYKKITTIRGLVKEARMLWDEQ